MTRGPTDDEQVIDQDEEWLLLTPAQRLAESGKLWELYLAMGGSLDPEPDPQSPFYYPEMEFASSPPVEVRWKMIQTSRKVVRKG